MIFPKVRAALLISAVILSAGCLQKELTPEEKELVGSLRTELMATNESLQAAKSQDQKISGGLIKALITVRIEILETNQALIQQRINAIESGAPVKQVTTVSTADPQLAKSLESEIEREKAELGSAQRDAQASGGLIGVMKAAAAATKEQTLAMLQQRYLSAKYGLTPSPLPQQAPLPTAAALPAAPTPSSSVEPDIPAGNGPFGLEAGISKEIIERMTGEILVLRDEAQNLYTIGNPPKPNEAFQTYALVISPTVGLCQIRAVGKTINSNDYGHQLKDAFTELQNALTSVYGKPQVLDTLLSGSIWKEPRDWMMSLYKKDRSLIAEWNSTKATPLKSDIATITMVARAQRNDSGYMMVQYSFNNEPACEAELKRKASGSL